MATVAIATASHPGRGVTGLTQYSETLRRAVEATHDVIYVQPAAEKEWAVEGLEPGPARTMSFERLSRVLKDAHAHGRLTFIVVDHIKSSAFSKLGIPYVYASHNCESAIARSMVEIAETPTRKLLARANARAVRRTETQLVRSGRCLAVTAISQEDLDRLTGLGARFGAVVHPHLPQISAQAPTTQRLLLVGSMNWWVKQANARWFKSEVFDPIAADHPDVELVVAGTAAAGLGWTDPAISVMSDVPSLDEVYAGGGIAVVPERQWGGVKLKTLEAAAHGLPIVSTGPGIEGTPLHAAMDVLVADDPHEMREAISALRADADLRRSLGASARSRLEAASTQFDASADWAELMARLVGL